MATFLSDQTVKFVRHFILMAAIALFYSSNNAWAQSTEIQELRLEVETLKKQVAQLESAKTVTPPLQQPKELTLLQAPVAVETIGVQTKEAEALKKQAAQSESAKIVTPPLQQPKELTPLQAPVAVETIGVQTKEAEALKKQAAQSESAKIVTPPLQQSTELNPLQTPVAVETPEVQTKKVAGNPWQALQVNLSKAEVTALLGKPGRIDKWKTGEAWYFPDPRGGEIDFNADEIVTGWLEP